MATTVDFSKFDAKFKAAEWACDLVQSNLNGRFGRAAEGRPLAEKDFQKTKDMICKAVVENAEKHALICKGEWFASYVGAGSFGFGVKFSMSPDDIGKYPNERTSFLLKWLRPPRDLKEFETLVNEIIQIMPKGEEDCERNTLCAWHAEAIGTKLSTRNAEWKQTINDQRDGRADVFGENGTFLFMDLLGNADLEQIIDKDRFKILIASDEKVNMEVLDFIAIRLAQLILEFHTKADKPRVHRDLKPSNLRVHVTPEGYVTEVMLIDFGFACSNDQHTKGTMCAEKEVGTSGYYPTSYGRRARPILKLKKDNDKRAAGLWKLHVENDWYAYKVILKELHGALGATSYSKQLNQCASTDDAFQELLRVLVCGKVLAAGRSAK